MGKATPRGSVRGSLLVGLGGPYAVWPWNLGLCMHSKCSARCAQD